MSQSKMIKKTVFFLFMHKFLLFPDSLINNFRQAHQEHPLSKVEFFIHYLLDEVKPKYDKFLSFLKK